jgi:hypothetical protein
MITVITHRNAGDALLAALKNIKSCPDAIVEVIDPAQSGRAVVERVSFPTKAMARKYIREQVKIDHWNRYELAP